MARGVQRIIRGWNHFYANFDLEVLVRCIERNLKMLNTLKGCNIRELNRQNEENIRTLFKEFVVALQRKKDKAKSPVSVAKAFGVLAPEFLPIWDSNIAWEYGCFYFSDSADLPYMRFCYKMKFFAGKVARCVDKEDDRSLLKRIDEYNYSKYTMHWIR